MGMEVMQNNTYTCYRCGRTYPKLSGYFYVSYGLLYRGVGRLPFCKKCVDGMFEMYLKQSGNMDDALRQMCRVLDLPWVEDVAKTVEEKNPPEKIMKGYIAAMNRSKAGRSYDDTLIEEGQLWNFSKGYVNVNSVTDEDGQAQMASEPVFEVTDDIVKFWGAGYTPAMYKELEDRRSYWTERLREEYGYEKLEVGLEAIIRQICNLEVDINRDRMEGKSIDKSVNVLNTLLTSANLKPVQKKEDDDASGEDTPLGVWANRLEYYRPIAEPEDKYKDVDKIIAYDDTWFRGHTCAMLKVKNSYSKLYEEAMSALRVEHPEYADEDDEDIIADVFGDSRDGSEK